jgi:subtilisin-like proprotein convertase family protein
LAPTALAGPLVDGALFSPAPLVQPQDCAEWVVILSGDSAVRALRDGAGVVDVTPTGITPNSYIVRFDGPVGQAVAAKALGGQAGVSSYYPNVARQQYTRFIPNDTYFPNQWHLRNTGQTGGTSGADANVVNVWNSYTGTGVTIAVVDDGLERTHPDLSPNYSAAISWDFNNNDSDPSPGASNNHGTAVAGVAAGRGNNGAGIAGAAYTATLGGIRLISAPSTDSQEASALTYQMNSVDIYSNSWGPADNGVLDGPGALTRAALANGARNGRSGKGNIYVWAGGNGQESLDNVNYDGYANSRYTIAVAAIDHNGQQSYYSEPGAPLLVSAYSSGSTVGITTTDRSGNLGYNGSGTGDGDSLPDTNYTSVFGGTSSAAPLVSGVIGLMLQANPNLTSRDVQHILVNTARKNDALDADWATNGAGLHVNHKYGFGAIDAAAAVAAAETWQNVGPEISRTTGTVTVNAAIPDNNSIGVTRSISVADDIRIEWVELAFNATHTYRGDLGLTLTSPDGTKSVLSEAHNDSGDDYAWTFTSARHWGELTGGDWVLNVADLVAADAGTWTSWSLSFFGTEVPEPTALAPLGLLALAALRRSRC